MPKDQFEPLKPSNNPYGHLAISWQSEVWAKYGGNFGETVQVVFSTTTRPKIQIFFSSWWQMIGIECSKVAKVIFWYIDYIVGT